MFTLEKENVVRVVQTEIEKDALLKQGFTEVKPKTKRAAKAQVKENA